MTALQRDDGEGLDLWSRGERERERERERASPCGVGVCWSYRCLGLALWTGRALRGSVVLGMIGLGGGAVLGTLGLGGGVVLGMLGLGGGVVLGMRGLGGGVVLGMLGLGGSVVLGTLLCDPMCICPQGITQPRTTGSSCNPIMMVTYPQGARWRSRFVTGD